VQHELPGFIATTHGFNCHIDIWPRQVDSNRESPEHPLEYLLFSRLSVGTQQ
jgi:hypothetical protein